MQTILVFLLFGIHSLIQAPLAQSLPLKEKFSAAMRRHKPIKAGATAQILPVNDFSYQRPRDHSSPLQTE